MSDHAKPEGASADALPRIAIVDWTDSEWTGGGRFWKHTQHMFEPLGDGAYRAKAADMWKFALRSIRHDLPVSFSLERVGWLAPGTDVDWAVANRVRPLRALAKLAEHYDLLFARASVVVDGTRVAADISRVAGKAIVGWIVEPPPFDHTHLNMAGLKAAHVCSACAWAHFTPPNRNVRYVVAPYSKHVFASFVTPPARRHRAFLMASRGLWHREIAQLMTRELGYRQLTEGWGNASRGDEPKGYASYLGALAGCRWVVSLDTKGSAGQLVAEASMLGVPVIAIRGVRANVELLLPDALRIPNLQPPFAARARNRSLELEAKQNTIQLVRQLIRYYETNTKEYAELSDSIQQRAQRLLQPPRRDSLAAQLTSCCVRT